jgi:hypothetical protein
MSSLPVKFGIGERRQPTIVQADTASAKPKFARARTALFLFRRSQHDAASQYTNVLILNAEMGRNTRTTSAEDGNSEPNQFITIHIGIVGCLASFLGALSRRFRFSLWVSSLITTR